MQANPFEIQQTSPTGLMNPLGGPSPLTGLGEMNLGPVGGEPDTNKQGLSESTFNSALEKMIAASGGKISITSGKRGNAKQRSLWQNALKKYGSESAARKWVAPPAGTKMSNGSIAKGSQHEHGLASDLKYADAATRKWAHDNAARFGLHFPLSNENWHIEMKGTRG